MLKSVSDIKAGDMFSHEGRVVWTAIEDAKKDGKDIAVRVRHEPDGGDGYRLFAPKHSLEVTEKD